MIKELEIFSHEMERQLSFNRNKIDWRKWDNLDEIISELEYHKAKLLLAIKENNIGAIKEYIADCANILMFIGYLYGTYKEKDLSDITYQMKENIFNTISINDQVIKDKFTNIK